MSRCRKRAAEEELPLRQIFDEVCRTVDAGGNDVAFAAIESSMYKRRRTAMPSLPTDPRDADAAIMGSRFASLGDAPFYRGSVNTGDGDTALIFASDGQLQLLRSCRLVYVDATFRVVPSLFYQLFTVFVQHTDHSFPVMYALMTRKTTALYQSVFEKLHELLPDFQPSQVIADFEEAPANAIRAVFGDAVTVSGCWFHYSQALLKRLRKIGLTDAYRNEENTQVVFRCLLALPLLPVADIDLAFNDVTALVTDDSPSKSKLEQLCRYVRKQWLTKNSIGPARLSVRDNTSRTNNAVESFHASLRRRIQTAHPNLFAFLGHLQKTTDDNQADVARLNRGLAIRRAKKRTNIINDKRIKTCIGRYDSGTYTRVQFLRAVSHSVGAHSTVICDDEDSDSDTDAAAEEAAGNRDEQPQPATERDADICEVCLLVPRDASVALVPCGHQRFCAACVSQVEARGLTCPICRSPITMVLRLY